MQSAELSSTVSKTKPQIILLLGPTAVGKTEISIELALRLNGEIVSADSRLFYRGMHIGTAKPSRADQARVPHHLIDISDPDEILSLAIFQQKAHRAIADIQARGKMPLLVGGTGQYVRAVTEGWKPPEVKPDERFRRELDRLAIDHAEGMIEARGYAWLHERLMSLDPAAAEIIDPRNSRRTIRALEVILTTGRKFSEQRLQAAPPYELIKIGLARPRPELYARIDARIQSMFENGLLNEVKDLLDNGYSPTLPTMSAIGYQQSVKVINGEWSLEQAVIEMRRATRVFVRRQANWFKESDPSIHWFQAGHPQVIEMIEACVRAGF